MELTEEELQIIRQWFSYAKSVYPMTPAELVLGHKVNEHLGFKVYPRDESA